MFSIPKELFKNKKLIFSLAKNDFKTRFAGSYFGILWAFVNPVGEHPYVLDLVSGIVPWFLFQEALIMGSNAMLDYSYLVKKVVFKIEILPMVKLLSSTFVHLFFIAFAIIIFMFMGYFPQVYIVQLLYYLLCLWLLILTMLYFTTSVILFFRDLGQIISIFMQVLMWTVPVLWTEGQLSGHPMILNILKINPMFYIITGYRDSLVDGRWFFEKPVMTLYFWCVVILLYIFGTIVFKRLRPHFADVL